MRSSAVEACRVLAGEVWRSERKLERFRSGGLNSEAAVRQRLHSFALELQKSKLDEKIALHVYSIDWLNADPLSILERTEGLVERQVRGSYASVDALLSDRAPASELAIRLLVLQSLGGRLGRWAVRTAEIPDARVARGCYRDLGPLEWLQYCRLTDAANAAFERKEYAAVAPKIFDADRMVRTPAALLAASVALSHLADYHAALWTIRACLLEPEETFESRSALDGARALEARLRVSVERGGDRFRPNGEHSRKPFEQLAAREEVVTAPVVVVRKEVPVSNPSQLGYVTPLEREHARFEASLYEESLSLLSPNAHHEMHTEMETAWNAAPSLLDPRSAEEVTYIPPLREEEEETQVPPEPELRRMRAQALCEAISAAAGLDFAELNVPPAGPHLTDGLTLPVEQATSKVPIPNARPTSLPTTRIGLKRTYEITQVIRARKNRLAEEDAQTEQLAIRSPFDRDS